MKNKLFFIITLFVFLGFFVKKGQTTEITPAFQFGDGKIFDIAYTPDGSKLAVGTTYGVEFLDQDLKRVRLVDLPERAAEALAFRSDGKQLAVVCNQQVYIWNENYSSFVIANTKRANKVFYSPNGKLLVLRLDGKIEFWETTDDLSVYKDGKPSKILKRHTFAVNCVAFAPDGTRMVSGGDDHSVMLWEVESSEESKSTYFASSEIKTFYRQPGNINSLAFLDDSTIVVASEQAVKVWDIETGKVIKVLASEPYVNFYASVDINSKKIAAVDENGKSYVWSAEFKPLFDRQACIDTNLIIFSPDGRSVVTASTSYAIEKWSVVSEDTTSSGEKIAERKGIFVKSVAFHSDGKTLVLGGFEAGTKHKKGLIILYNLTNGQEIKRLDDHAYPVNVLRFSPDGKQFLSWSTEGLSMKLWDTTTWQVVNSLKTEVPGEMPFEYDLNEDEQYVILASGNKLTLWDAEFDVYHHPNWPQFYRDSIFRVLSRDGKFYAFADGKSIIFTFPNKQFVVSAHKNIIKHLQLSPDAKYLASISWGDNISLIWALKQADNKGEKP